MADLSFGAFKLKFGSTQLVFGGIVVPQGSPGGGGTVSKAPDHVRPNRRTQVRDMLADELDRAQRVEDPAIETPKPRRKPAKVVPAQDLVTTDSGLAIVRQIEARVQAAIDAAAFIDAEAMALQLALIAEDEADIEVLLLAAW